ncbi:MAG: hypothetical protein QOF61_3335 [Acidobacteriota bacterium]|jgi:hypothetical protein|nr:hypothetical protein [Acidobacteriota bacterium]
MLKPIALLLIMFSLLAQNPAVTKDAPAEPYVDADAYEVYSTILPSEWPLSVANAKTLVIRSATVDYKMCLVPEKESEGLVGAAISDYAKKNEKTWLLQPLFNLELRYQLIAAGELKSTFERGGWDNFYKQHPNSGGWIELSAVGFNADKTVAVVYMGHHCGMLCGGGGFHVLQKKDGKWVRADWKGSSCAWDS